MDDIHEGLGPFSAVDVVKLLQHDLYFLAIGRVHGDEMKTLPAHGQPVPFQFNLQNSSGITLASLTSAGVASSKRWDILLLFWVVRMLSLLLLTLSIGVLGLRCEDN